jgi:hypothetical protein
VLRFQGRRICKACSVRSASRPRISVCRSAVSSQSLVPPPLGRLCPRSPLAVAAERVAVAQAPRAGASAASRARQYFCASPSGIGLVRLEQCCLTLRSSGLPPARHLARAPVQVIIRLAGQAPSRRQPLSSNVRQHHVALKVLAAAAGAAVAAKDRMPSLAMPLPLTADSAALLKRRGRRICQPCPFRSASRPRISVFRSAAFSQSVVPPPLGRLCRSSPQAVAAD